MTAQPAFKLGEMTKLVEETPKRVATVSVTIGSVTVHGVIVWRGKNGHLRVFWPEHKSPAGFNIWLETVELAPDLREQIEASVIAAYKDARKTGKATKPETPADHGLQPQ